MPSLSIAILGPGGVGGFLAGVLARAGADVTVVAREATAEVIARDGLVVESAIFGELVARPGVTAHLERDVDVLVIATKAGGLEGALERVAGELGLVVPLLNGLDHLPVLRARWGSRAVAATIRIEADRPAPGQIVQTGPATRIDLASEDPERRAALDAFAAALAAAELPARVEASEAQVMWSKLVRLNTLALMTSAYDEPIGPLRDDPARRPELIACVGETAAAANADGAAIDRDTTLAELDGLPAARGSSMQRDIAGGRVPELDAIAGAVLRAGARHGIPCPTVAALAERVAARAGIAPPVV